MGADIIRDFPRLPDIFGAGPGALAPGLIAAGGHDPELPGIGRLLYRRKYLVHPGQKLRVCGAGKGGLFLNLKGSHQLCGTAKPCGIDPGVCGHGDDEIVLVFQKLVQGIIGTENPVLLFLILVREDLPFFSNAYEDVAG